MAVHKIWSRFVCFALLVIVFGRTANSQTRFATPVKKTSIGQLGLSFAPNRGQFEPHVRYVAHTANYSVVLRDRDVVLLSSKQGGDAVTLRLSGASAKPTIVAESQLPGKANFLLGSDRSRWQTNLPTFDRVRYRNVYPGIDVVYYGNDSQMEHDFIVAPGANPARIRIKIAGANRVFLDRGIATIESASGGLLSLRAPVIYQESGNQRVHVDGSYELVSPNELAFSVGKYDHALPLTIDPVLVYALTLSGGTMDKATAIAADSSGNAYIAGMTSSSDFPGHALAAVCTSNCTPQGFDAFVMKVSGSDSSIIYSTFFGGSSEDDAYGIAVDAAGNAYIVGRTFSNNFPVVNAAQGACANNCGSSDAFVAKLDPTGSKFLYSTFLGGSAADTGSAIAVDSSGNAYITGDSNSKDFPVKNAYQSATGGLDNVIVAKFDPNGTLVYSTYVGGSIFDSGKGIAVDANGNAYVAGSSTSSNFPTTPGAFQTTASGGSAFVLKLNPSGSGLVYSTFIGGSSSNVANAIAVDSAGSAYVTGATQSTNFPLASALQTTCGGCSDNVNSGFVTKVKPDGSGLVYSTYLGGGGDTQGFAIAVDSSGQAVVAGQTAAPDFPTVGASQTRGGGGVFASFDGGLSWNVANKGLNSAVVRSVAFDSRNAVLYAGTSFGMYVSADQGQSWKAANSGLPSSKKVGAVGIDPAHPQTVYAAIDNGGVYKTTDGATSWNASNSGLPFGTWSALVVDPLNSSTVYVGGSKGLFKSADGGATWTASTSGLPPTSTQNLNISGIVADPVSSGTVFVTVPANASSNGGVFKSTNGGTSWIQLTSGLTNPNVNGIAMDPANHLILYCVTDADRSRKGIPGGAFKSVDGGATWSYVLATTTSNTASVAVDPANSANIFIGMSSLGEGGVISSTDGGTTWNHKGLVSTAIPAFAIESGSPSVVFAATDGRGTFGQGGTDGFVAQLNAAGTALVFSTYLGSTNMDTVNAVAVSSSGAIHVAGWSQSLNSVPLGGASAATLAGSEVNAVSHASTPTEEISVSDLADAFYAQLNNGIKFLVTKTASTDTAKVGDIVTFTVTLKNLGPDLANVEFFDYPSGLKTIKTPSSCNPQLGLPGLLCGVGPMLSGRTASFDFQMQVTSSTHVSNAVSARLHDYSINAFAWLGSNGVSINTSNSPAPVVTTSTNSVSFGTVVAGTSSQPQRVTLTNTGSTNLNVSSVTASTDFSASGTCSGTIGPGNACYVDVAASPAGSVQSPMLATPSSLRANAVTVRTGTLTIVSNATNSPTVINLTANVVPAGTIIPQSGWWWDPNLSGTGFFLEYGGTSGSGMFGAGFVYDASGTATWDVTTGPVNGSIYSNNWLKVNGGQTLTGPYKAPAGSANDGAVTLTFTDASHATMTRSDGSKINLQRFSFTSSATPAAPVSGAPQSGWWWAGSSLSGTGYGIEIQGSSVFAVAYVYDSTGNPTWYLATGSLTSPTSYTGTWDVFAGGPQLNSPEGTYNAHKVSSATAMSLTFTDATHGTITMGTLSIPITRFQGF